MRGTDIPQADDLSKVRAVVQAVQDGAQTSRVVERVTGITPRHVGYNLQAASILGLLEQGGRFFEVSERGRRLLATVRNSHDETDLLREAITNSDVLRRVAPDLLGAAAPTQAQLASEIARLTSLSAVTARRRAQTLLSWRAQVQVSQGGLRFPGSEVQVEFLAESSDSIRLKQIRIVGYGPIRDASARLQEFSVILGRNATGKSTFMDSMVFVADALEHGPLGAIQLRAHLFEDLLWNGEGESFRFEFEFDLPPSLFREGRSVAQYQLEVGRIGGGVGVRAEHLFLHPGSSSSSPGRGRTPRGWKKTLSLTPENGTAWYGAEYTDWKTVFNLGRKKLALSAVPEDIERFPVTHRIRDMFRRGVQRIALHAEAMKGPCSPMLEPSFRPDGSNLPVVVRWLESRDRERFEVWKDHLREALPDVEDVRVIERPEDRHLYLKLCYRGGLQLPAWRLSEGTLRLLALTLLPFAAEQDMVYLIEEPENGVHPQALEALHQVLDSGQAAQILVATHSPVFVGLVRPEQLLCFMRESGSTQIVSGDNHPALRKWKREIDLGTLFATAVIG